MAYNKRISYLHIGDNFDDGRHVIVTFYAESSMPFETVAEAIAAESSVGTWTDVAGMDEMLYENLGAKVFYMDDKTGIIRIAYPIPLFETDNVPQLLSDVSGNVFGLKELKNLRVIDIDLPEKFVKDNKGPAFGIEGIREHLNVHDRPLLGAIIKPKCGLPTKKHVEVAYNAWVGGVDVVKDDENLTDQIFNPFYERVTQTLEAKQKAEQETGERKAYVPNITARISEMYARAKFIRERGGRFAMIDIVTTGFSGVQFIRDQEMDLILHGHRAMHGAFTHSDKHGVSMLVIAKLARLAGIDQLHTGTVIGKMEGSEADVTEINKFLRSNWFGLKTTMPIASGGLHPGHVPELVEILGKDVIINMGGGIHGHPDGTRAGAKAARQALEAAMEGKALSEHAKSHSELSRAIEKWGVYREEKLDDLVTYRYGLVKHKPVALTA